MSVYIDIEKKLGNFHLKVKLQAEEETLALLGASGCGKTMTLKCIAGIEKPDRGTIVVDGVTVFDSGRRINLSPQKRRIGFLFQNYALFPNMTVEKNILYGLKNQSEYKMKEKREEMLQYMEYILDTFRIGHLRKKYPYQISGGEKQRTALARAIVTKPDLLLLDEPFSALDLKTKKIVYQEFLDLKQQMQMPIILISHDPKESDLFADHRLYLEQGRAVEPFV